MGSGIALLAGMGALSWFGRAGIASEDVSIRPFRYTWVLAGLCALALALTAASLASFDLPHGDWDAWSIWNLRAKFLAARRVGVMPFHRCCFAAIRIIRYSRPQWLRTLTPACWP
jgi:hypothetical protein